MWSYRFRRRVLGREIDLYYVPFDGHYLVLGEGGPYFVAGASRELLAGVPVALPQNLSSHVRDMGERYLAVSRMLMALPPGTYAVDSCRVKPVRFNRLNARLGPILALAALIPLTLLYLHVITAVAALMSLIALMIVKVIFTLFEWREDKRHLAEVSQLVGPCPTELVIGEGYALLVWERGEAQPVQDPSKALERRFGRGWAKLKFRHMVTCERP